MTIQQMFLGSSVPITASWDNKTAQGILPPASPLLAEAGITLSGDGTGYTYTQAGSGLVFTWLQTGVVGDYSIRAVLSSGTPPSGNVLNTWMDASTFISWGVSSDGGLVESVLTATLRHNPSGTTWDSLFTLRASKAI